MQVMQQIELSDSESDPNKSYIDFNDNRFCRITDKRHKETTITELAQEIMEANFRDIVEQKPMI